MLIRKNFCPTVSQRCIFVTMCFITVGIFSSLRAVFSIAITEMVITKNHQTYRNETHDRCYAYVNDVATYAPANDRIPVYDWNEHTQGLILSSSFWAYGPMHFVYAPLIQRYGGKYFLAQAIFLPSLFTLTIPYAVAWQDSTALVALRFLFGFCSGAVFPSIGAMTPHWMIPSERTRLGFICAGYDLGTVFGSVVPALIIKYSGYGWPAAFYFFGSLGVIWLPFWLILCYNDPDAHPFITDDERNYLLDHNRHDLNKRAPPAPYRLILTSKRFWAFTVGLFSHNWTYLTMGNDLPKYMKIIGLRIDKIGYVTAASYLLIWLNSLLSSWIVTPILSRQLITKTTVRKIFTCFAIIGPAIFIISASYAGCRENLVSVFFIVGMMLLGCGYASLSLNNLDLSPNYAGTLISIANGLTTFSGIVSPYVVGVITTEQTIGEWRIVFWINFAVALVTSGYFVIFGSGELQKWNDPKFNGNGLEMTTMEVVEREGKNWESFS